MLNWISQCFQTHADLSLCCSSPLRNKGTKKLGCKIFPYVEYIHIVLKLISDKGSELNNFNNLL